jgi:hypothetical protein
VGRAKWLTGNFLSAKSPHRHHRKIRVSLAQRWAFRDATAWSVILEAASLTSNLGFPVTVMPAINARSRRFSKWEKSACTLEIPSQ